MKFETLTLKELELHRRNKVDQLLYWNRLNSPKYNLDLNHIVTEIDEIDEELSKRRDNKINKIIKRNDEIF